MSVSTFTLSSMIGIPDFIFSGSQSCVYAISINIDSLSGFLELESFRSARKGKSPSVFSGVHVS